MRKHYVSVSTDPIKRDFEKNVPIYAREMLIAGADFLHCDIMDGKFVKQKTFDEKIVKKINDFCLIPLDVHLMVEKPQYCLKRYAKCGANIITIHYEAIKNKNCVKKTLKKIKKLKVLSGLSIKPETSVEKIKDLLEECDLILVMSVEPGKSGQKFLENAIAKVEKLNEIREKEKLNFKIEVDGGIDPKISKKLFDKGADVVVSGSFIFNSENKESAIKLIKNQRISPKG